jgi:hypothetical protein
MAKVYISEKQGQAKLNLSRGTFRKFADSCGATIHIGRSVRFDEEILDKALEELRGQEDAE